MKDYAAKLLSLFILLGLTVFFGLIPYGLFSRGRHRFTVNAGRYRRAGVSLASCFAGGIFFGTCLLHLIPEVRQKFQYVYCRKYNKESTAQYPFTELTVACGFFVVLVFEQLVLIVHKPRLRSRCSTQNVPPHGCNPTPSCQNCASDNNTLQNIGSGVTLNVADVQAEDRVDSSNQQTTEFTTNGAVVAEEAPVNNRGDLAGLVPAVDDGDVELALVIRDGSLMASTRALLLLAALSFHSLFEGLALGLQDSSSDVFQVFAAVAVHKCLLAFSLGVRLINAKVSVFRLTRAVLILGLMSPVGVVIGIAVSSTGADSVSQETVSAALEGLAAGTFLFVTFFEILTNEIKDRSTSDVQMAKVLLAVVGFVIVAATKLYSEDDQGDKSCRLTVDFTP